MSPTTFASLGVPDSICGVLARRGIDEPFEIQAAAIVDALAGRDVCGRAPTGSGKTLAFGIPLIATVGVAKPKRPRALVLAPTRELADQIADELRKLSAKVRVGVVYGGVGYGAQLKRLRQGVDILVACPGRLEDLMERRAVSLGDVDQVVIDEADRMADMGFLPVVRRILDQTADDRQTMLFSATLDGDVAKLTRDYQRDPVRHEVGDTTPDITAADHRFWQVDRAGRVDSSASVIASASPAIAFCRTRHGSDRLARQLKQRGVRAVAIHGGHSQNRRTRALAQFAAGEVDALVATDVAARGIHVDGVASVIHFDPAEDHKAYVHRSGRTARAGEGGLVVSLVQPDQISEARQLQRRLGLGGSITTPSGSAVVATTPEARPDKAAPRAGQGQRKSPQPASSKRRHRSGKASAGAGRRKGRSSSRQARSQRGG
jgi:superfamily II DNA/RNA helicase